MLSGGCLCGAVRFELEQPPSDAGYCHCTRCQGRTGSAASAQALVEPGTARLVSGAEQLRAWCPPDGMEKCFCGSCGAHLFSRLPGAGPIRAIRMSAFDTPPDVRLSYRQYVAYAASWEPIPDDTLERFPESRF